ncbi:protein of unassigned function [Methylobacterium oryzae CBMB20]|uniref:Protein of unassigned function n=1 Tax=Methylobacterium oryzae CBMB20 TaxID=693986 RepID=A0A089NXQ9_9HYPH|nr:protein of unassigned function [Methylobacterium oryzae CBMB20]
MIDEAPEHRPHLAAGRDILAAACASNGQARPAPRRPPGDGDRRGAAGLATVGL